MQGTNSSDRETNGRVSGRAGDLGGGPTARRLLFPPAPSRRPVRSGRLWTKSSDIGAIRSHPRAAFRVTLVAWVVGCSPTLKWVGCARLRRAGQVLAGRPRKGGRAPRARSEPAQDGRPQKDVSRCSIRLPEGEPERA